MKHPCKKTALAMMVCLFGVPRADAGQAYLGTASTFNVFTYGDMTQSNDDAQGAIAVGGNATLTSFAVADSGSSNDPRIGSVNSALVVGGSLNFTNGSIDNGNALVAGNVSFTSAGIPNGAIYYGGTTTMPSYVPQHSVSGGDIPTGFFSSAETTLTNDSTQLSHQAANGTVTLGAGNALTLTGSNHSTTNYFTLTAAEFASASHGTFTIDAPAGSTVIINVEGAAPTLTNSMFYVNGVAASDVLFNFYQATSLSLTSTSPLGSILAPDAIFTGSGGHSDGNFIVNSITTHTSFEYHNDSYFDGTPTFQSVPEPSSMILLASASGIGGIVYFRRRRASSR